MYVFFIILLSIVQILIILKEKDRTSLSYNRKLALFSLLFVVGNFYEILTRKHSPIEMCWYIFCIVLNMVCFSIFHKICVDKLEEKENDKP